MSSRSGLGSPLQDCQKPFTSLPSPSEYVMSNSQLPRIKRVRIDEDLCCAHYLCEIEAPEIFHEVDGEWTARLQDDVDEQKLQGNFRRVMWAAKVCRAQTGLLRANRDPVCEQQISKCEGGALSPFPACLQRELPPACMAEVRAANRAREHRN